MSSSLRSTAAAARGAAARAAGCSAHPAPVAAGNPSPTVSPSPSPLPSPTAPALALAPQRFLGTAFLAPKWPHRATVNSNSDGFIQYTGPGGQYSVYLEVNGCSACVDQGLVQHGLANGVPDPTKVLGQNGAVSVRQVDATRWTFTSRLYGQGPLLHDLLVIADADGSITGYVLLEVSLPPQFAADTSRIIDSLVAPARIGAPS
jgi:hypothetical protein